MEPDQDYQFDLDGDGVLEKIRYSHGHDWDEDVVLYVNDQEVYRRQMEGFGSIYTIADLDVREKGLNLLLGDYIENYIITYTELQKYEDGQIIVGATSDNNRAMECFGSVMIIDEDGQGDFFMLANQHSEYIGSFYVKVPYSYRQGDVQARPTQEFALAAYSLEFAYQLLDSIEMYADKDTGSTVVHTLTAGDVIRIEKIIPINHTYCVEGPRQDDVYDENADYAVYIYVIDQDGNEGWLYLDKQYSYYTGESLFQEIPSWA